MFTGTPEEFLGGREQNIHWEKLNKK